jgi:cysteine desulfurase/selenocysteine lyase
LDFPVDKIREDFPALHQEVYKRPLVYLDNAATTQKPLPVIRAISSYYERDNCNIHRGVHYLSVKATEAFEETRCEVKDFINAGHAREIIFTRGATEAINLVAASFGRKFLHPGDEIILSIAEHHSNFVPWQQICQERGAILRIVNLDDQGQLVLEELWSAMNEHTRLIALTHASNVLGTVNPVKKIIRGAHERHIPVLLDGAQAIAHMPVDVQDLDADFYAFSGHKMYGPMGIGVLYGKEQLLNEIPPYQLGGEMIREVWTDRTEFNVLPFKFEAGTPNVEGVAGLRAAIKYLQGIGMERIAAYEKELLEYVTCKLQSISGLRIFGTAEEKASLVSFLVGNIHHYDMGMILDKMGVAVRTGHHCAMPLMTYLGISGTVRASFSFYNTMEEADRLVEAIRKAKEMLA